MANNSSKILGLDYEKLKGGFQDLKTILSREGDETRFMLDVYKNSLLGNGDEEEMRLANEKMRDLLKMVGLLPLIAAPGAVITIPLVVTVAKKFNLNIIPRAFSLEVSELGQTDAGEEDEK